MYILCSLHTYITKCYCKQWINCSLFSDEDIGLHVDISRLFVYKGVTAIICDVCFTGHTNTVVVPVGKL